MLHSPAGHRAGRTGQTKSVTMGCVLVMTLIWSVTTGAHPMSHSVSRLEVAGRDVRVVLTIDLLELGDVDRNGDRLIGYGELDSAIDSVYARVRQHYVLRSSGDPVSVSLERYEIIEDGHIGRLYMRYTFAADAGALDLISTLDRITTAEHRHLASVVLDGAVEEAILDASQPAVSFGAGERSHLRTIGSFVRLGVEHIFTGYDHLAFLVCLLIGTTTVRSLVRVISSFTIAHSITLALATFDAVVLPPRLIESLIALSIAYVAVENLAGTQVVARYQVTFFFGLIHGFGFSNILREMDLPRSNLALSLFSFNAGVEIGQLVFVLVLFPLIAYLTASRWARVRPAISLAVFGMAVYWFAERAFLR